MQNKCCGIKDVKNGKALYCPTCGNKMEDITSLRCPRCFASLIKAGGCSGNCAKCGG